MCEERGPIMNPDAAAKDRCCLWYDPTFRRRWRKLKLGTEVECNDFLSGFAWGGDFLVAPAGIDPNREPDGSRRFNVQFKPGPLTWTDAKALLAELNVLYRRW